MSEKTMIYDRRCMVLTDYEEGIATGEELYKMLADIQNAWETVITTQED